VHKSHSCVHFSQLCILVGSRYFCIDTYLGRQINIF
jgi:hypothetical protein